MLWKSSAFVLEEYQGEIEVYPFQVDKKKVLTTQ